MITKYKVFETNIIDTVYKGFDIKIEKEDNQKMFLK
jgi:hypothetical protein